MELGSRIDRDTDGTSDMINFTLERKFVIEKMELE